METDGWSTPQREQLPSHTINTTLPRALFCPTKNCPLWIIHIDDLALYHLSNDEYQAEIEISPLFKQHSFVLDPELEERIKEEGMQLIDLIPADTASEAIARLPPAGTPIIRSWSATFALHLYYCRICGDFDTGLPSTQVSERHSRVFHQMHVRRPAPFPT